MAILLCPQEEVSVEIQPEQLELLMEDLVRKLQHALPASASKRRCPLKVCGLSTARVQLITT